MSPASRRKNSSVIQGLLAKPFDYSFKQAVRLLERAAAYYSGNAPAFSKNPVARYTPPSSEVVRFHTRQSLSFPAGKAGEVVRAYTKESLVRADLDDALPLSRERGSRKTDFLSS